MRIWTQFMNSHPKHRFIIYWQWPQKKPAVMVMMKGESGVRYLWCIRLCLIYPIYYAFSSSLDVVERFDTYESYLDSQLTAADMNYLEDDEMARQLVELGYRGLGDTIRRDVRLIMRFWLWLDSILICQTILQDFEARKRLLRERTNQKHSVPKQLASLGRDLTQFPFLQVCFADHWILSSEFLWRF